MIQLENKGSGPWELKGADNTQSPPAQWTKLTEEQKKEQEKKTKEEVKKTHYTYYIDFPPFGTHITTGVRLDQRPHEIYYMPLSSRVSSDFRAAQSSEHMTEGRVLVFEITSRASDYIWYRFKELR